MKWVLFAMGVLWMMSGTLMFFATQITRDKYYDKLKKKDPRVLSPMPIVVGILLLASAKSSSQVAFIAVLGALALAKGLIFLFGARLKLEKVTNWWLNATDTTIKVCGVALVILGIAVMATLIR